MIIVLLILLSCTGSQASKSPNQSNNNVGDTGSNEGTNGINLNKDKNRDKSNNSNLNTNDNEDNDNKDSKNKNNTEIQDIYALIGSEDLAKKSYNELDQYLELISKDIASNIFNDNIPIALGKILHAMAYNKDVSDEKTHEIYKKISDLAMEKISSNEFLYINELLYINTLNEVFTILSSRLWQKSTKEEKQKFIALSDIAQLAKVYSEIVSKYHLLEALKDSFYSQSIGYKESINTINLLLRFMSESSSTDDNIVKSNLLYELVKMNASTAIDYYLINRGADNKQNMLKPIIAKIWQEKNLEMYEKLSNNKNRFLLEMSNQGVAHSFLNVNKVKSKDSYEYMLLCILLAKDLSSSFITRTYTTFDNIFELATILEISEDNKFIFNVILFEVKKLSQNYQKRFDINKEINEILNKFKGNQMVIDTGEVIKNKSVLEYFQSKINE